MKAHKRYLWPVTILSITAVLTAYEVVSAATFNNIFNNVEQGANSASNPSLNVSDGKILKNEPTATPAAPAATPSTQAAAAADPKNEENPFRHWRFGFMGHAIGQRGQNLSQARDAVAGVSFSTSYFFLKDFGISAFSGLSSTGKGFLGGELEFVPIRLTVFGFKDLVELGALAGASNLGGTYAASPDGPTSLTMHLGARVSINMGDRYALIADTRTNVSHRSQINYLMGEAGLAVRF